MPELRIIYDVEGWAFAHTARALQHHAPPDFRVSIAPLMNAKRELDPQAAIGDVRPDVVFVMHTLPAKPALIRDRMHARGWRPALVGAWNCGWPLQVEALPQRHAEVDALLFNNTLAWQHVRHLPRVHLCPQGVDFTVFRPLLPIAGRQARVLCCGSEYWRQVKGYDDLLLPLQVRLHARGIACDFRIVDSLGPHKQPPAQMAEWFNSGTVLVCASLTEGTPNTALEAAACGCTIVSTRVGNMPELITHGHNGYLVDRTVDALEAGALQALANYEPLCTCLQTAIREWGWERRASAFFAAFRAAMQEARA